MDIHQELPPELHYLIDASQKYGIHQSDAQVHAFLANATPAEMEEIAGIADRLRRSSQRSELLSFLDRRPITEHEQSAQLYFLLGILDAAGLEFDSPDWDSVESHMRALQRFGSFRLASERMHSAKFLAAMGRAAKPTVPLLEAACSDEDERVQVWARFALAKLVGNTELHSDAIRKIFSSHDEPDEYGDYDEVGEEAFAALELLRCGVDSPIDDDES